MRIFGGIDGWHPPGSEESFVERHQAELRKAQASGIGPIDPVLSAACGLEERVSPTSEPDRIDELAKSFAWIGGEIARTPERELPLRKDLQALIGLGDATEAPAVDLGGLAKIFDDDQQLGELRRNVALPVSADLAKRAKRSALAEWLERRLAEGDTLTELVHAAWEVDPERAQEIMAAAEEIA